MNKNYRLVAKLALLITALLFVLSYLIFDTPDQLPGQTSGVESTEAQHSESASSTDTIPNAATSSPNTPATTAAGSFRVQQVIDGDTFTVFDGTELLTVRVLGIDAPETEHADGGAECYNEAATVEARKLLSGSMVTLYTDNTQDTFDTYGRLLAYVDLANGTDFGAWMIENGYAKEYTFKGVAYERQSDYQAAESKAQAREGGLWGCEN